MSRRHGFFQSCLANKAGARLLAVDASAAAEELRRRHGLAGEAALAAAEGLVAAQLMSAWIKGEERITLQVQGELPRFALTVDVNAAGSTRGRFTPARLSCSRPLRGLLLVIKHDAERELYRGVATLADTDFQGALQAYLEQSQQTVGIVRVGASLDAGGGIGQACGLLVEKLPDQDTELFQSLFGHLPQADLSTLLEQVSAGEICGFPVQLLDKRRLVFRCQCSRERSLEILRGLGGEELGALLQEQGQAELTCNFCREIYEFDAGCLRRLLAEAPARD